MDSFIVADPKGPVSDERPWEPRRVEEFLDQDVRELDIQSGGSEDVAARDHRLWSVRFHGPPIGIFTG